jgi:hypothetical protein
MKKNKACHHPDNRLYSKRNIAPQDSVGGQVHIEIVQKWRCRWVSRKLRDDLMNKLISVAKGFGLKVLYSTAFTSVSPRLLEFAGFTEYNVREPKTYYYLMIDGV